MSALEDRPQRRFATWTLVTDGIALVEEYAAKFELNGVGTFIWLRCDGRTTTRELANEVARVFAVTYDQALPDMIAFVDWLRGARLLESDKLLVRVGPELAP